MKRKDLSLTALLDLAAAMPLDHCAEMLKMYYASKAHDAREPGARLEHWDADDRAAEERAILTAMKLADIRNICRS